MTYKVKYVYDNPSGAGPFKGWMVVRLKYAKGATIAAPFGSATVTSCSLIKA